jgi:hypothetical protein
VPPNNPQKPGPRAFAEPEDRDLKVGLKKPSGQKSMFEGKPRPPTPQEHQERSQQVEERKSGYKQRAADLFTQFNKSIADKTLPQNRNILNRDAEREMLQKMMQLGMDINNDPMEEESMGSLTLITCLFKVVLAQRDRINELEYLSVVLQKKLDGTALTEFVQKEIVNALKDQKNQALDNKKSEG